MKPKNELLRVVRTPEGIAMLDFRGRANGRGAYVCHNEACLTRAVKSRALSRALEIAVPDEIIAELQQHVAAEDK